MELTKLHGQTAVVTGAGSGVGRKLAGMLSEVGVRVVLSDIHDDGLNATLRQMNNPARHLPIKANVSREEEVRRMFHDAAQFAGAIHILINCAAIWDEADVADIDDARLERMLSVNLKGSFYTCREAFIHMRSRGEGGSIVNIASTAGEYGSIRPAAHYAASKGGIIAMTKSLAREGAKDRIRVNVVSPGPLDTAMNPIENSEQRAKINERTLLGRVGTAQDIGNAVMFLASPGSSWITGEVLRVNGGSLL